MKLKILVALIGLFPSAALWATDAATLSIGSGQAAWTTKAQLPAGYAWQLTVAGPNDWYFRRQFSVGAEPSFAADDNPASKAPDGVYQWELIAVKDDVRPIERTDDAVASLDEPITMSGSFSVQEGALVDSDISESGTRDNIVADDQIVQGSLCVGFDCANGENFGFDTIRLKENNTRIKFEDTSVGSFPSTDWQLTANDSASGGANRFSIEDITASRVPFTIEGAATTNSIYVDSTGRIGLRTSTPVLDLHIRTNNTPSIRLEQDNSGGFTAQTWDIAGNEANFFVRDVTGGSKLPFRIRPGAPTSSIDISASGMVGIGTASPDAKLDVDGDPNDTSTPRFRVY